SLEVMGLGNAVALAVHHAEVVLRTGIALLGEWPEVLQRRRVVLLLPCGQASLEVRGGLASSKDQKG
ncbi:MAG: hypothetical protein VB959_22295, partial [Rhodospirillales bacterium]